jgi:hypothetical protein
MQRAQHFSSAVVDDAHQVICVLGTTPIAYAVPLAWQSDGIVPGESDYWYQIRERTTQVRDRAPASRFASTLASHVIERGSLANQIIERD